MLGNRTNSALVLAAFVAVGILLPDFESNNARQLSVKTTTASSSSSLSVSSSTGAERFLQDPSMPVCDEVTLDWEKYPTGASIKKGDYIGTQFEREFGLTISAVGASGTGHTPESQARIFDTSDVEGSGDEDLGTPNEGCVPGSPGVASDSDKETAALTNCEPLHNIIIIEEHGNGVPDDNGSGGTITFEFERPVYKVLEVGLIDMEHLAGNGDYIELTYGDNNEVERIEFDGLGDNTVQTVNTAVVEKVSKVDVTFRTSGGIPHIKFIECDDSTPEPTPEVTPVTTPNPNDCLAVEELFNDDFTNGVDGWGNGELASYPKTGQFLGRYVTSSAIPYKQYEVGTDSEYVMVEWDFLELDSWDNSTAYGRDNLEVMINGDRLEIGVFSGGQDDGKRSGISDKGIEWTSKSTGPPEHLGGESNWMDQIHHMTAKVPKSLYTTGNIMLSFHVDVSQSVTDESAGFDNIVLTAFRDCGGVNGDPLVMGLAGQLFKFEGRSGSWYSAVSTSDFQWNMKIQQYEECPAGSDKFVSGVGFTLKKPDDPEKSHKVVVNVVNPYNVQTGCGTGATNCLGGGSLEIVIDGQKLVYPGDYRFHDKTGRIIAFNTFYECARKWYDFDSDPVSGNLRNGRRMAARRLESFPGVYDVVKELEENMVDRDACDLWVEERQKNNDLFRQPGEWSTIIVKTDVISFHIEYKQEHNRCNAHTIDVWIAGVSPDLFQEEWEGIIGETKDPKKKGSRTEILKFVDDNAYVVTSPFSTDCSGCYQA